MSQRRTIIRNVLSNYVALSVQLAVRLAQLSLFVRALGEAGLGLFTLLLAIPAISQIAGYSLSKGTIRFLSQSMAKDDRAGSQRYFNSSFVAFTFLAILAALSVIGVRFFIEDVFDLPSPLMVDARRSLLIIAVGLLLTVPFNCAQGACQAAQRHDLVAASRIIVLLLQLGLYIAAFLLDQLTVSVAFFILFATRVAESLSWWAIARRALPGLSLSFRLATWPGVKAILLFAAGAVVIDLANIVGYEGFKFLLGAGVDLKILGAYGVFAILAASVSTLTRTASQVLMPVAGKYDALQDRDRLARLFYLGTKLTMLAASGMVLPLLPFLPWLLTKGISGTVAAHWTSCAVLLGGQVFLTSGVTASSMLAGVGRQQTQVQITVAWVVVGTLGSAAALWASDGTLLWPVVIMSAARALGGLWLAEVGRRTFGRMPPQRFWWHVLATPLLAGLASMIIGFGLDRAAARHLSNPWVPAGVVVVELLCFGVICWFGALTAAERQEFLVLRRPKPPIARGSVAGA